MRAAEVLTYICRQIIIFYQNCILLGPAIPSLAFLVRSKKILENVTWSVLRIRWECSCWGVVAAAADVAPVAAAVDAAVMLLQLLLMLL